MGLDILLLYQGRDTTRADVQGTRDSLKIVLELREESAPILFFLYSTSLCELRKLRDKMKKPQICRPTWSYSAFRVSDSSKERRHFHTTFVDCAPY